MTSKKRCDRPIHRTKCNHTVAYTINAGSSDAQKPLGYVTAAPGSEHCLLIVDHIKILNMRGDGKCQVTSLNNEGPNRSAGLLCSITVHLE